MSITTRTFDQMVDAIMDRIIASNVGITDKRKGSLVRSWVEAIVSELDMQYYQMSKAYRSSCIDDAKGTDIDRIVSILGVVRNAATPATGSVRFSRSTPATYDIPVPYGTVVSTRPDNNGKTIEFKTTSNTAMIATGDSYVDVDVESVTPKSTYVAIGGVSIMNHPIIGIETVANNAIISGGTDAETDSALRSRAKMALAGLGKGTDSALESAIKDVDGVLDAIVLDKNRGVGTSDIIVIGATIPVPQSVQDQVMDVIGSTKASGIDIGIIYPTVKSVAVTITLTNGDVDLAGNAILEYFKTLTVGEKFIVSQMERRVLAACIDDDTDIATTVPAANVVPTGSEIIRPSTITINGAVWNG